MLENVLLIYNAPVGNLKNGSSFSWQQSNAGVLDEVQAVCDALEALAIEFHVQPIESLEHLCNVLADRKEHIIFNLVEEFSDCITDACYVPALCRAHGKVCTGSDSPALLLTQNKWQTKAILKAANLPCPQGKLVPPGRKISLDGLSKGKYIVKPLFSDASEGIDNASVADLPGKALDEAIDRVHNQMSQPAIVEQFIPERELNVSVLQQDGHTKVLAIAEIDFSKFDNSLPRIVDYAAKWQQDSFAYNNTPRIIPAPLSTKAASLVTEFAVKAFEITACQDYARVDFRMDANDQPFILEINANPDISPDAGFAAAVNYSGLNYENFIRILLDNAVRKNERNLDRSKV